MSSAASSGTADTSSNAHMRKGIVIKVHIRQGVGENLWCLPWLASLQHSQVTISPWWMPCLQTSLLVQRSRDSKVSTRWSWARAASQTSFRMFWYSLARSCRCWNSSLLGHPVLGAFHLLGERVVCVSRYCLPSRLGALGIGCSGQLLQPLQNIWHCWQGSSGRQVWPNPAPERDGRGRCELCRMKSSCVREFRCTRDMSSYWRVQQRERPHDLKKGEIFDQKRGRMMKNKSQMVKKEVKQWQKCHFCSPFPSKRHFYSSKMSFWRFDGKVADDKKMRQTKKYDRYYLSFVFIIWPQKKKFALFFNGCLMFHETNFAGDAEVQLQLGSERQHHLQRRHWHTA